MVLCWASSSSSVEHSSIEPFDLEGQPEHDEDAEEQCSTLNIALPDLATVPHIQAVLFDFDATLTVKEELPVYKVLPERSGFGGGVDTSYIRDKGFGGSRRVKKLESMLQAFSARGIELHIVSYAEREVIVRSLTVLGLIHFFGDRILGWKELGSPWATKGAFISHLLAQKSWTKQQVLFVDDQERNIVEALPICLTHRPQGQGLSEAEMDDIQERVLHPPPAGVFRGSGNFEGECNTQSTQLCAAV